MAPARGEYYLIMAELLCGSAASSQHRYENFYDDEMKRDF